MDYKPAFRRETSSELTLQPSSETVELSNAYKRRSAPSWAWSAERMTEEAKDGVVASVGDPGNTRLVLSESTVQYQGETFKWLLTHHVGYAVMVLAAHQPRMGPPLLDGRISNLSASGNTRASRTRTCMRIRTVRRGGAFSHRSSTARRAQEPSDAKLLAVSMELDAEAPSSSAPEVPAPPQRSLQTAEPEKQTSRTQPVPTAEVLLPEDWKQMLPREQHHWVSWVLFTRKQSGRPALTKNLCLWWSPPGSWLVYAQPPSSPNAFFHSRLLMWMPYRMLSCEKGVVCLMRGRTLGNSVTSLHRHLCIRHRQQWLAKSSEYLFMLKKFLSLGTDPSTITHQLPPMVPVPTPKWLLTVYVQDVLSQLEQLKTRVTSIYRAILNMDSTNKVTKKLAGVAASTAAWAKNVGNEFEQVLISVLMVAEGEGLLPMCVKLMERNQQAREAPPQLLYVDCDCCFSVGKGKAAAMFHEWDQLVVRLNMWHFMRRFVAGVTTDSHQLYCRLSFCVFKWDVEDVAHLQEAKQLERGEAPAVQRPPD
ncbi:hypothetical protein P4O66_002303 [Electrophorus voltai]|uniref:DUF6729 domain-containing protein n=1 Tax=Electrophorus voltai TaxID=2609070 RepID=A0AAD8YZ29_9TELE|nr:hypothetical protein P4O66_002303 [Electrophorus voltai]